jgi:hypothetical protein
LRAVQLDNTSWYKEKTSRSFMSIDDLAVVILHEAVQHIDMCSADDEEAGCD